MRQGLSLAGRFTRARRRQQYMIPRELPHRGSSRPSSPDRVRRMTPVQRTGRHPGVARLVPYEPVGACPHPPPGHRTRRAGLERATGGGSAQELCHQFPPRTCVRMQTDDAHTKITQGGRRVSPARAFPYIRSGPAVVPRRTAIWRRQRRIHSDASCGKAAPGGVEDRPISHTPGSVAPKTGRAEIPRHPISAVSCSP